MARSVPTTRVLRVDDLTPRALRARLSDHALAIAAARHVRDHALVIAVTGRAKAHALATVAVIAVKDRGSVIVAAGASAVVDVAHEGVRSAPSVLTT
jgi:hypothetical protein